MASSPDEPPVAAAASGSSSVDHGTAKPQIRFRKADAAATTATAAASPTDLPQRPPHTTSFKASRRASSVVSAFSETSFDRASLRSSTDDFLRPRPRDSDHDELHKEPSFWHSAPLLFALLPAVAGVLFKRGSAVLTDLILLVFATIYLNWCLITPWYWYHSAQTIRIARTEQADEAIDVEEEIREEAEDGNGVADKPKVDDLKDTADAVQDHASERDAALQELRIHEAFAFALCFAGPLLGAWLLHVMRASLSQFGDDMVSSLHLSLFVLAAELRPLRHFMKMVQSRTIHLQRVVREDPFVAPKVDSSLVEDLTRRLGETESSLAVMRTDKATAADSVVASTAESIKKSQLAMQAQIDALNRAVRRYEKRATAQTIQNEARMQDLENRLRDALSLAAAAASYSQEPGLVRFLFEWTTTLVLLPVQAAWAAITYPFRLAARTLTRSLVRAQLVRPDRRRKHGAASLRRNGDTSAAGKARLERAPAAPVAKR